jgi:hypothetical protein
MLHTVSLYALRLSGIEGSQNNKKTGGKFYLTRQMNRFAAMFSVLLMRA